jgi:EAL domain-containing protein (putative c-di-GMP-specific phosphodiesterase class I)
MDTIEDILIHNKLIIHLQPILSLRGRELFGVEALVRGINEEGMILSPKWLFSEAKKANLSAELDRQARQLAIHAFAPLWAENSKLLLFVNFEPKLIDSFKMGNYLFDGLIYSLGIPYSNIVLEIKEDEINDTEKLKDFCNHYRKLGFNIAIDDFGVGQSSFDRLAIIRPDIIKIDRSLIENIDQNHINQEIVQAICKISNNIGALALAEGVETLNEAVYCKYLGASLIQGFYFARPSQNLPIDDFKNKIEHVKSHYKILMETKYIHHSNLRLRGESLSSTFGNTLLNLTNYSEWMTIFDDSLDNYPDVEAIYLINANATQIGHTLLRCSRRSFFQPTIDGCDHSYKEYYLRAKESSSGYYLTDCYVSLASGNTCRTYSKTISVQEEVFVLCIDFIQ